MKVIQTREEEMQRDRQTERKRYGKERDRKEGDMARQTDREKEIKREERKRYSEIGRQKERTIISEMDRKRERGRETR